MKKFAALFLTLVMVCGLAACSSGGGGDTSSDGKEEAKDDGGSDGKVELNVIAAQYGQNTGSWWEGFVKDFTAEHSDIDLNVEVVSWNDIYTVVNTRISNNDAPDILNIDVFANYQADGLLLPAEDFVSKETYDKMYPAFLEQSDVDGTIWAIPDLASARALYYNADILKDAGVEVPTTWDELTEACKAIKAHDSKIYPWGIDMTTDEGQAAFAYYTWNNGGGFVDDDGNWVLNSDKNVEAIEYAINLVKEGYTNSDPANDTRYDLQDMFGAGQVAMMIVPNSIPTYIADGGYSVNYAVAPIPTNGGVDSVSAGVMDRFMCFDNDYSDAEMEAIKTFFDFFYEDARYSEWVLMEGFLPATSTGGEILAKEDESMASWVDIVGSCKFYPTAKTEWDDVKQGVINVEQQALLGGNVKELLDELQAEIAE
ncbi:MAG: extracellular solute-binding protein [Lachnospiraceae bacterium]